MTKPKTTRPTNAMEFFGFAKQREEIRLAKESGARPPWTQDQALQRHYFCNIFREDDRTTRWFAENIRGPLAEDLRVVMATMIFRFMNRIDTGERIKACLLDGRFDRVSLGKALRPAWKKGERLVTGAYMIKTQTGVDKLEGCLQAFARWPTEVVTHVLTYFGDTPPDERTLQETHSILKKGPFLGPFLAYEIVTDLRHTEMLRHAADINTWASAGPGCERGLSRVWTGKTDQFPSYYGPAGQAFMNERMQELLKLSRHPDMWSWPSRPWEMREVEHTACEYDKYKRYYEGGRMKRRYHKGGYKA